MRFTLAVTRTAPYNLHNFSQRGTYTDGNAAFTPRPVETFLSRAECYQNIKRVTRIHTLQIGLKSIPARRIVFYQISHLQDTPVRRLYMVDVVFVVSFYNLANTANDISNFIVLRRIRGFRVHIGNMYQYLLRRIKCLR